MIRGRGADNRLRAGRGRDWLQSAAPSGGIELLRAWFAGRGYDRHRHDTYAICVTDQGIQAFDYRGASRISVPGQVTVLHPDECHDGRAGSDEGFSYRIIYVAPAEVAEAARALCGAAVPLPFAGEPVSSNPILAKAVRQAFLAFPAALEPLAIVSLIDDLTRGLIQADPSFRRRPRCGPADTRAVLRARDYLDAARTRVVGSGELEAITGHSRFALSRQFRQVCGTSPYRYLLSRRLDRVRTEIWAGGSLAEIALDAGFADQAHMTRIFKANYGLTPAQYRALSAPVKG
jgi:AraC-like DNA-binding protein